MGISKNIRDLIFYFLATIILISFSGCSATSFTGKKKPVKTGSESRYLTISEADKAYPPMVVEKKDPEKTVTKKSEIVTGQKSTAQSNTKQQSKGERTVAQGYRIQLLTTEERELCDSLKTQWEADLGLTIYRSFESPYYKLRVGDFETEDKAKELLRDLQKRKFDNVWIVRDRVFIYSE